MFRLIFSAVFLTLLPHLLLADPSVYSRPGIIMLQGNKWEGSDHLLNLKGPINIVVEILKPKDKDIPLSVENLQKRIIDAFSSAGLRDGNGQYLATPGIPFFHVLIVAYPVEKGFAAVVDARLMEVVDPYRVKLDKGTFFQAITWEKKSLLVAPNDEFRQLVDNTVDDLVKTFLERESYFKSLKDKLQNKDSVERLE